MNFLMTSHPPGRTANSKRRVCMCPGGGRTAGDPGIRLHPEVSADWPVKPRAQTAQSFGDFMSRGQLRRSRSAPWGVGPKVMYWAPCTSPALRTANQEHQPTGRMYLFCVRGRTSTNEEYENTPMMWLDKAFALAEIEAERR